MVQVQATTLAQLRPGDVIWCDYWAAHDLVISTSVDHLGQTWVVVRGCDRNGVALQGFDGRERRHCTQLCRRDRVYRQASSAA